MLCVLLGLALGVVPLSGIPTALRPLGGALGFLLAAIPLSVLLDRLGFFENLAIAMSRWGRARGWLWVLAAGVTILLNLDAAVVLLTPLYVRLSRRMSLDPIPLAFQPVLLASLASAALPVSNLTNLVVVGSKGVSSLDFLINLGVPTLVAVLVGYVGWRRAFPSVPGALPSAEEPAKRALVLGGCVVSALALGFVAGPEVGIAPWEVALGADIVLLGLVRELPWRSVPVSTALVAAGIAVLAETAVSGLAVARLLGGTSALALVRTMAISVFGANLLNNLPATLVAMHGLSGGSSPQLWAVLLGVDMGPVLLVTGSLAGLLWLRTMASLAFPVTSTRYSLVGLAVGLPAVCSAAACFVLIEHFLHG